MAQAGIRLTIERNGVKVLDGDSAWLHMKAIEAAIDRGWPAEADYPPVLFFAEASPAGVVQVWVQAVTIPDPP